MQPGFWTDDVDRDPDPVALRQLADKTAVPLDRLAQMGLSSYEAHLWDAYHRSGSLPWVMPIGRYGRRRFGHGQQFCRRCLAEDAEPYFRRRWRLAFNTICDSHGVFLDDACRRCGAPVEFHAGDFGKRLLSLESPITRCATCGTDFREGRASDRPAPKDLTYFQSILNDALHDGYSKTLIGAASYSFLAFDGLRYLARLLCSRSRGGRLRSLIQAACSELPLDVSAHKSGPVFEELRVGDRAKVMGWCQQLLEDWPVTLSAFCRQARVSSSYILRYDVSAPYWLQSAVYWNLFDRDYAPTEAEKTAATNWLQRQGLPVNANSVRRWLGVSHSLYNTGETAPRKRWNPRGPRANERPGS